jgi:nickel-dependent lactate racemase
MKLSQVSLPYGHQQVAANIPTRNLLGVYYPMEISETVDEGLILQEALANPIGTSPLREIVHPGQKIAIVTSDITRPTPSAKLLSAISLELEAAGIPDRDIFVVIGLGLHRPMNAEEIGEILSPEFHQRYEVLNHDPDDTVHLGITTRGTPVEIFRPLVEADVRICLGNIEFHYYAGYSGGVKAILPGCASRATVSANHSWLVDPQAEADRLADNPVRMDLEEGASMLGADFILNVVVDGSHRIAAAFAGDVTAAHRLGCSYVHQRSTVKIPCLGDIVIASAGGFPKDIDFYQAHKALENAKYFVRDGGIIILVAECIEGYGNQVFEEWMLEHGTLDEVIQKIREGFVLYGHKAAAIGVILQRAQIFMVSSMPEQIIRRSHFTPFGSIQSALTAALHQLGTESRVLVLPQAGSTLPDLEDLAV